MAGENTGKECSAQISGGAVWTAIFLMFATAVLSVLCLLREPGTLLFWMSLFIAFALATTTLLHLRQFRRPYLGPDEQSSDEENRTALLFVHGMGVQDRYQMLDEVANALPRSTGRYKGKLRRIRANSSAEYLSLKLDCEDGTTRRIDVYEAYYGNLFNRLAKLPGTIIFALKTLIAFVPTLATRLWKKRLCEAAFVVVALAALWQLIAGVYCGFIISNQTLVVRQVSQTQAHEVLQWDAKSPPPASFNEEKEKLRDLAGSEYTNTSVQDIDDASANVKPVEKKALNYTERLNLTIEFIKSAAWGAWDGTVFRHAIPLEKPLKYVKDLEVKEIAETIIYSIAFALLFLKTMSIIFAQFEFLFSGNGPLKENESYQSWRSQNWLKTTRSNFASALLPLLIVLLLDPIQDLVLTQIFTTAALLIVALKGLAAWTTNFLGDVMIYATQNANAETDSAREQATILVADRIRYLLKSKENDRVIVLAHSLGTVVSLNAVRRIFRQLKNDDDLQKLKLLITVGSPLRKFRQLFRVPPYLWSFGDNNLSADKEIFVGEDNLYPGELRWKNYWYKTDLFADRLAYIPSGKLEKARKYLSKAAPGDEQKRWQIAYDEKLKLARLESPSDLDLTGFRVRVDQDFELKSPISLWSHSNYWLDPKFVDELIAELAKKEP